ncbi:MAG: PPK2 family polyphosphate kinase [Alphaproteobacteria bacterium]
MSHPPKIDDVRDATLVKRKGKAKLKLSDWPTRGDELFKDKKDAKASLDEDAAAIDKLQDALFAEGKRALLVVLQGIDTSGKDGTVKSVFKYTSPLGVRVHPFGAPTSLELKHDYLWRIHQACPQRGHIGVFNRSHYEDVLVVKVRKLAAPDLVEQRYDQINEFERMLTENGTRILKLMLHVSKEEQGERLRERLEVPTKRWKFNPGDLEDRKLWDDYAAAYTTMLERCSSDYAPWHVVPSDSRSRRDAVAARLVRGALEDMDPQYPDPGYRPEQYEID